MKYLNLLPLAAFASGLIIPDEQVLGDLSIQANHRAATVQKDIFDTKDEILDSFKSHFEDIENTVEHASKKAKNNVKSVLDEALGFSSDVGTSMSETAFDAQSWINNNVEHVYDFVENMEEHDRPHHPHGPPKDHPPHHGPPRDGPPHHGPRKPHHPPHHHEPNQTVYELIAGSKYTTKLAKLINDYPDLVEALNGTKANFTVFAPTDRAFEKIPEHAPKPTKEQIEKILSYHVSPDFFPAGRVLATHTIPTLLKGEHLAEQPEPQRLSVNIGLKGLTLNFYSRVVAIDIFGTNGVIHGIDTILQPPPNIIEIVDLLPSEFSTLELGLVKTGLLEKLNSTDHPGGTFFAPSNFAFQKLGPRINAFLFSSYGEKYLKALLLYHVGTGITLYSDAYYGGPEHDDSSMMKKGDCKGKKHSKKMNVPKGYYHFDVSTMLEDKTLNVDIARYGGFIGFKVNGFARVVVQDGIAQDGVIQVVSDVLIPPKSMPGMSEKKGWFGRVGGWMKEKTEGEMSVEEFKSRFAGLVDDEDVEDVDYEKIEM